MSIPDSELERIFADLTAKYEIQDTGPGEFTAHMYAEERGLSWARAKSVIKRALRAGELVQVGKRRDPDGIVGDAYRLAPAKDGR